MTSLTQRERFLQSLGRCSTSDGFIPAFYARFMSSSKEVQEKFRSTDFAQQNKMLLRSLQLCAGAVAGEPEALREINERAETHDRLHLDIQPRHYALWLAAIIATAREFDDQWDDTIEAAWRSILGHVVNHMVRKY